MNKSLIEAFKNSLMAIQAELQQREQHNKAALDTVELDQNRMGRLTRMDALQGQQMAQESERRRLQQLKQVAGALYRIQQGEYGLCFKCDTDIAVERLRFDPTITRCIACSELP